MRNIVLVILILFFAGSICRAADDVSLVKLKAENTDLKRKLQSALSENALLKDLMDKSGPQEQKGHLSQELILRKKLAEASLELMATKNKDQALRRKAADLYYNLGTVLLGQKKFDEAIGEFDMDLKMDPIDADAHYNLALIYDKYEKNRNLAIRHYKMYLAESPQAADALKVKERLTDLEALQKVWGSPDATGINEPGRLGRL